MNILMNQRQEVRTWERSPLKVPKRVLLTSDSSFLFLPFQNKHKTGNRNGNDVLSFSLFFTNGLTQRHSFSMGHHHPPLDHPVLNANLPKERGTKSKWRNGSRETQTLLKYQHNHPHHPLSHDSFFQILSVHCVFFHFFSSFFPATSFLWSIRWVLGSSWCRCSLSFPAAHVILSEVHVRITYFEDENFVPSVCRND